MIRWRYVLTRFLIVALILVLFCLGLGPAAHYVTIGSLESATGAKVEIDRTSVVLYPPQIQYSGVQVADPRSDKEMENLFEADLIKLEIDGRALLQRRWVANEARITGLRIGSDRATSGHYETIAETEVEAEGPSILGKLLGGLAQSVGDGAEAAAEDLETVRRSQEIRDRWERDYKKLVSQARDLEQRIRDIRDSVRGIDNPLRDWAEMDRTLAKATQAREQLNAVRLAIDSLPEQVQNDLASLEEAKRLDLAKVDQYVPGDLSQSSNFGVDLMSKAIRDQVQRVRDYMESGRDLANYTVVAPEMERVRGVDYDLWGDNRPADLLIRRCELGGWMRADGNEYELKGIVENVTATPERLSQPTRARLRLEGPEVVRLELVRDRRNGADVDLVTLHWPQTRSDSLRLGNKNDASIAIEGGQRELWVQIRSEGEQLAGQLISKQTGVNMKLDVDPKYANLPAVVSLSDSLATVNNIEIDARFTGTWRDMDIKLNSNLGQVFQRASRDAIAGQVLATKQKMAAKVEQAYLQQSLELRKWLSSRQGEARTLLASADKSIEEMSRKVITEMGDADAYLGKLRSAIQGRLR